MPKRSRAKEESEDEIDKQEESANDGEEGNQSNDEPTPFAAALGLHRVGSAFPKRQSQKPVQALNARGMPARIRKKNKFFFDDDIVTDRPLRKLPSKLLVESESTSKPSSPEKTVKKRKITPSKISKAKEDDKDSDDDVHVVDRTVCQRIGLRLRNILKLPKAHKWVSYEFFYSYLDRPLFEGENDFQNFLRVSFPFLTTRQLTRIEWNKVRQLMGKPRRSSQAFFDEERIELERRRQKIRLLQTRKFADLEFVRDLPSEIPLPLPIGTKVTARLRLPQDGLFTGCIDAFDSMSGVYRITFDRVGLGTHSVPDYEVAANEFIESIPISTITKDKSKSNSQYFDRKFGTTVLGKNDSELSNNNLQSIMALNQSIGGFQLELLETIVRAKRTISEKQLKLVRLKNMNIEAELLKSNGDLTSDDFQRRYASIIIGIEKLNGDLAKHLSQIQTMSRDLSKEPLITSTLTPNYLHEHCKEMASKMIEKNNQTVKEESMLRLITDLATVMFVASNLSNSEGSSTVRNVLEVCLEEAKNRLNPENIVAFQKNVQVHLKHLDNEIHYEESRSVAKQ